MYYKWKSVEIQELIYVTTIFAPSNYLTVIID